MESKKLYVGVGLGFGLVAVLLAYFGNPANMAICVACFIRDIAGSAKLHMAPPVQYLRPEIIGIIFGAMLMAIPRKEFAARSGSSTATRFLLGFMMMIGALMFLGCPLRMILRMGGGDLNAYVGLIGFVGGVLTGSLFLKKGYTLGKAKETKISSGFMIPGFFLVLFVLFLLVPTLFIVSAEGPGSFHAPVIISLVGGLVFGGLAQLSAICFSGSIRDIFLMRNFNRITGVLTLFVVVLIYNLTTGSFHLSFADQPIAHTEHLWNILGLYVVGFAGVLLSGCPLRQLILTGQGSSDAGITVIGMLVGAAFAHNFGLASSGEGTTSFGRIAVILCIVLLFIIAFTNREKRARASR
ncbi:YedE family putative selenium transporter [Candidatus Enterococcus ferrettii]|uniref:Sulphur transport domain-containing protein n=1 Tax=Candidatus Enterococcus ferrettii TaxID=2815324 RepID=A0ABV0EUH3_9ENTE|nr:YedE family putative selenium transporter [Enterococcus sp. 665A]MBO1341998.1 YedE-related selenium metabolism membrane protein [Enterococcus sp. 665A]